MIHVAEENSNAVAGIVIRKVANGDFLHWKVLWDGYNAFYGRRGQTALSDLVTATTWSRFFDESEPVQALVAERAGELLGLAHFLFHRSTISVEPTCYLQDLFVIEPARSQGLGRALILRVYELARDARAARVYWQTHETNVTAMRLYDHVAEKSGFIVYRKFL